MSERLAPPLAVLAELTHRCPLQCAYCSNPLQLTAAQNLQRRLIGHHDTLGRQHHPALARLIEFQAHARGQARHGILCHVDHAGGHVLFSARKAPGGT